VGKNDIQDSIKKFILYKIWNIIFAQRLSQVRSKMRRMDKIPHLNAPTKPRV
jgi:hypothetical protein